MGMMTLTQYLDAKKITQAEFARRLGVNQGTVSKLCRAGRPSWRLAARIEDETGGAVPVSVWAKAREAV
jgi:transcriptional regulator with XRE-family HTH domain